MKKPEKISETKADYTVVNQKYGIKLLTVVIAMFGIALACHAQEQRVTIKKDKAEMESILKEVQKQTGLDYIFNHEKLPAGTKISIDATNETLQKVLEKCLENTGLTFKIIDGVIVITPRTKKKNWES